MSGTPTPVPGDPNLDAMARGLGQALADATDAKATLHGTRQKTGVLTEVELLKSDVRHGDERVTEFKELFGSMFRQLDGKIDVLSGAVTVLSSNVTASNHRRLHPLVTALLVVCMVVITGSAVAVAGVALHASDRMDQREREGRW